MNEAIIAAVAKRQPLWNPKNALHRNVYVLKKLWKEVAVEVQKDVKTIKARWKNLRAYYYKEHRKVLKSKDGDGRKTGYSTWQYYDHLEFLKSHYVGSERGSTVSAGDDDNDSMIYEIPLEEQNYVPSNSGSESMSSHSQEPPRKTTRVEDNDQLLEIEKRRLELLERECVKEKSDDLLFFESLLPYMNNIPLVRKLRLRSQIQDLILAEIEAEEGRQQDVLVIQ